MTKTLWVAAAHKPKLLLFSGLHCRYFADDEAKMGNPEFHRFLQAVGIEMSREEAATIFYAILHNDNSGSSSGGTSPANSAPATNGVQAEPRLQLLPRIGFLQFDR